MNKIELNIELAKDILNIIHKAKHPHFESEIIDRVKSELFKLIQAGYQETKSSPESPLNPNPDKDQ